jgi:hypothetical protein
MDLVRSLLLLFRDYLLLCTYLFIHLRNTYKQMQTTGARGCGRQFALDSTINDQAQLNRACNIFNFAVLGFL